MSKTPRTELVEALLEAAFHQLQHDTGQQNPEYLWQRKLLGKEFNTVLNAHRKDAQAELAAAHAELERVKEIARLMHQGVLPDPHDEREISLDWLKRKVTEWATALQPEEQKEGK